MFSFGKSTSDKITEQQQNVIYALLLAVTVTNKMVNSMNRQDYRLGCLRKDLQRKRNLNYALKLGPKQWVGLG